MQATREGALLILGKWAEERSIICCNFNFGSFAASLRGRVLSVSDEEITIASDDRMSELVLRVSAIVWFGYGEPRNPEEGLDACGLMLFFTRPDAAGNVDFLAMSETIEARLSDKWRES